MRALLGTIVFTVAVPGSVVLWIPRWMIGHWPFTAGPVFVPAVLLAVAGLALYIWSAGGFVRQGQGTPAPCEAPKHLVIRGPYRFFRNPMYAAVLAMVCGEAISDRSALLGWYAAGLAVCFHAFVVLYEERALSRRFGADYHAYRRTVPRWLPRFR